MSLQNGVNQLREQLGFEQGMPLVDVVERAVGELEPRDQVAGKNLVEKVDMCLNVLGIAPAAPSVVGAQTIAPAAPSLFGFQVAPVVPVIMGNPVEPAAKCAKRINKYQVRASERHEAAPRQERALSEARPLPIEGPDDQIKIV